MTVVKAASSWLELGKLAQFMGKHTKQPLSIRLIAPVNVQMQGLLNMISNRCIRDQQRPLYLDGARPVIPTTNEKGYLQAEYHTPTQTYRLALRLDNYIVQQTIPGTAYV